MAAASYSARMVPSRPSPLGVVRAGERSALELAAASRAALDRPLRRSAELTVAVVTDEALVLGAFQRAAGFRGTTLARRGSGGPEVRLGPGTLYVALALAHPSALVACDEKRIVNRHVRPLLRALTRAGSLAHYFGRDWISVAHRPVGWVGFGHDAATRRTLFEAFVAVRAPCAWTHRASFLGRAPATLEALAGRPVDTSALAGAVIDAYGRDAAPDELPWADEPAGETDLTADPPWAATVEEAIGTLGAGPDARGTFRVGGDLLVSRDALAALEARVPATPDADVPVLVDETLAAPGVALDGVRTLASIRDVILRARHG
jgi:hypothetical protein